MSVSPEQIGHSKLNGKSYMIFKERKDNVLFFTDYNDGNLIEISLSKEECDMTAEKLTVGELYQMTV